MNEKVSKTLKSSETEDWLDYHVVRPFCYYWAVFFNKFDIHPNTVTIMSMIVGAASSLLFAHGCYHYEGMEGLIYNLIAMMMLFCAEILDCTDGQLARMSGKKSRLGRILDGAAGPVWFVPIYLALVYRFYMHHDIEFGWLGIANTEQNTMIATAVVLVVTLISGFWAMTGQQRLADYYIQAHLFFLNGEKGSELDNSEKQREIYEQTPWEGNKVWKTFLKTYISYTQKQEQQTPEFQKLMGAVRRKGGIENIPQELREEFHAGSLTLMKWNGMLVFNFRTAFFYLFCLLDVPVMNFLFEIIVLGLVTLYINKSHEALSKRIALKIEK